MVDTVEWTSPAAGSLGTVVELHNFTSPTLVANYNGLTDVIEFILVDGELPHAMKIVNDSNTPMDVITGLATELDDYVPGWVQPADFTYHDETAFGAKYDTFGSGLYGQKVFTFTIRAINKDLYDPELDPLDQPGAYKDRVFSITVMNNYSSDRDSFILREFTKLKQDSAGKLVLNGITYDDPLQYLNAVKANGDYD